MNSPKVSAERWLENEWKTRREGPMWDMISIQALVWSVRSRSAVVADIVIAGVGVDGAQKSSEASEWEDGRMEKGVR